MRRKLAARLSSEVSRLDTSKTTGYFWRHRSVLKPLHGKGSYLSHWVALPWVCLMWSPGSNTAAMKRLYIVSLLQVQIHQKRESVPFISQRDLNHWTVKCLFKSYDTLTYSYCITFELDSKVLGPCVRQCFHTHTGFGGWVSCVVGLECSSEWRN